MYLASRDLYQGAYIGDGGGGECGKRASQH